MNNQLRKGSDLIREQAELALKEALQLRETYKDYAVALNEAFNAKYKQDLPDNILATTLQSLNNLTEQINGMNETTRSYNLGSFVDYGYQLISAVLPNLITNEIASIQPLKVRTGDIFYLDYAIDKKKGNIAAGKKLLDAKTGPSGDVNVSTEQITSETSATGNGADTVFEFALDYKPVRASTVTIIAGGVTVVDNGSGTLSGSGLTSGTIDYTTGQVVLTYASAVGNGTVIYSTYKYNMEDNPSLISRLNISLSQVSVTAEPYKFAADYSLDAAFDLQQAHGVNADTVLVAALASLIRAEVDNLSMTDMYDNAAATATTFDAAVPNYVPLKSHYESFVAKVLVKGANTIFKNTRTVSGNFIICGVNVANIVESLDGFEGVELVGDFAGPHVSGTFRKKWKVIKNPNFSDNNYVIGHKGGNYLNTGYVFAPYRALYTTPPIVLDDDKARRGMAMSAGRKMVNSNFYIKGSVSNV